MSGASLVFILVFGGHIPHLHLHLSPSTPGGPRIAYLFDRLAEEADLLPEDDLRSIAKKVRRKLGPA
ncbi:MAG TPA: hypothetical protein VK189_05610 [Thermoplasmata archaeon]|nr:hypothetical protein [Thermoplasmata archaeon]